jgi:hypothetical protein
LVLQVKGVAIRFGSAHSGLNVIITLNADEQGMPLKPERESCVFDVMSRNESSGVAETQFMHLWYKPIARMA